MRELLLILFGCLLASLPLSLMVSASLRMGARETVKIVVSVWALLALCLGFVRLIVYLLLNFVPQ